MVKVRLHGELNINNLQKGLDIDLYLLYNNSNDTVITINRLKFIMEVFVMNDFLNALLLKTKEVAEKAGKKTGEVVESSKLKIEAMKTENAIKGMYEKLGIAVYSMIQEDYQDNELLITISEEIDDLYDELEEITRQIDLFRNAIVCPICDAKNDLHSLFCNKCGAELVDLDDDEDDECACCCGDCNDCKDDCADDKCGCGCGCDDEKCDCDDEKCDCDDEKCDCSDEKCCCDDKKECTDTDSCGCKDDKINK